MKQLDPKAVWLFFIGNLGGLLLIILPIIVLVVSVLNEIPFAVLMSNPEVPWYIILFLQYWWVLLVLLIVLGYLIAYLSWHYYRYELRDDGFRKESGIIVKKYVAIPYERIQNVDIYRSLPARLLGLSDLHIQTAGMSAVVTSRAMVGIGSEGRLPGLSRLDAEKIRDELMQRIRNRPTSSA